MVSRVWRLPGQSRYILALRGIVAVLVMLHHLTPQLRKIDPAWVAPVFGGLFDFNAGRIEFFLVASGFLTTWRHLGDIGHPGEPVRFARRRFLSVYPIYWLVLGGLLIIGLSPIGYTHVAYPSPDLILTSMLLAGPGDYQNIIGPAWTLWHEILFYALFAAALLGRRVAVGIAIGWTLLIVTATTIPGVPPYVTAPINLLFLIGAGAAILARHAAPFSGRLLVALVGVAAGLLIAFDADLPGDRARHWSWGLVWAAAIAGLLAIEARCHFAVPAALLALGRASFVLYLVHMPLLVQLIHLTEGRDLHRIMTADLLALAMAAVVIALAVVGHLLVERPIQLWLRRRNATPALAVN